MTEEQMYSCINGRKTAQARHPVLPVQHHLTHISHFTLYSTLTLSASPTGKRHSTVHTHQSTPKSPVPTTCHHRLPRPSRLSHRPAAAAVSSLLPPSSAHRPRLNEKPRGAGRLAAAAATATLMRLPPTAYGCNVSRTLKVDRRRNDATRSFVWC